MTSDVIRFQRPCLSNQWQILAQRRIPRRWNQQTSSRRRARVMTGDFRARRQRSRQWWPGDLLDRASLVVATVMTGGPQNPSVTATMATGESQNPSPGPLEQTEIVGSPSSAVLSRWWRPWRAVTVLTGVLPICGAISASSPLRYSLHSGAGLCGVLLAVCLTASTATWLTPSALDSYGFRDILTTLFFELVVNLSSMTTLWLVVVRGRKIPEFFSQLDEALSHSGARGGRRRLAHQWVPMSLSVAVACHLAAELWGSQQTGGLLSIVENFLPGFVNLASTVILRAYGACLIALCVLLMQACSEPFDAISDDLERVPTPCVRSYEFSIDADDVSSQQVLANLKQNDSDHPTGAGRSIDILYRRTIATARRRCRPHCTARALPGRRRRHRSLQRRLLTPRTQPGHPRGHRDHVAAGGADVLSFFPRSAAAGGDDGGDGAADDAVLPAGPAAGDGGAEAEPVAAPTPAVRRRRRRRGRETGGALWSSPTVGRRRRHVQHQSTAAGLRGHHVRHLHDRAAADEVGIP